MVEQLSEVSVGEVAGGRLLPFSPLSSPDEEGANRRIFDGDLVYIGLFHSRPWHPLFHNDNFSSGDLIVFPHSSVYITHEGEDTLVADPNVVVFYNQGQSYQRNKLSERGDFSAYFGFQPQILFEAMRERALAALDRPESPFRHTHAPSDAYSYLLQQLVVAHVLTNPQPDPVYVEEAGLTLLERVLARTLPARRSPASSAATRRAHRELAQETRSLLATCYQASWTLAEIAGALYTSPYHLSRVFRQQTGETIHQYRNQLRLRAGLAYVLDTDLDLSTLALELGYASHSHFTQTFRRVFGVTPSTLRHSPALAQLSKNLTV